MLTKYSFSMAVVLALTISLSACGSLFGTQPTPTPIVPTATPAPPTATPEPSVAVVNGEFITLVTFNAELGRYQTAVVQGGQTITLEQASQAVLDDLINTTLLAQGAEAQGFQVTDEELQARMDALSNEIGGPVALADWQNQHGYTEADFRSALKRSLSAAWMRDQIIEAVPITAEQVHAQQILLYNEEDALLVKEQLNSGTPFETLAAQYTPDTKGELGWFPRGYLLETAVEDAAFSLEAGGISDVIRTDIGYHIIKVVERDPAHTLTPDAYLSMQEKTLADWLLQQRENSTISLAP
ncbi:MAG: peptidylprolyl isomerase [Anaerolineales bacterium]|nr:peptidylprolyl isomerase [Anaerolineales bacterium]